MRNTFGLFIVSLIFIFSNQVYASKAYLSSLGQDTDGSFFIEDERNIFLNPAHISKIKNRVYLETGSTGQASTPQAEGGLVYELENSVLGLYLGRDSQAFNNMTEANNDALGTFNFQAPRNTIDLIWGKELDSNSSMGLMVQYATSEVNADITPPATDAYSKDTSTSISVRGGLEKDKINAYAYFDVKQEAETETALNVKDKFDGKTPFGAGLSYELSQKQKVYVEYEKYKYDVTDASSSNTGEVSSYLATVGYGHYLVMNKKTRLFVQVEFQRQDKNFKDKDASTTADNDFTRLPLTIGFEAFVKPWLELQASITQRVVFDRIRGDENSASPGLEKESHRADTATVAGGARVRFDNFEVDGQMGVATTGNVSTFNFLTNASLSYLF